MPGAGGVPAIINDTHISSQTTWSSEKLSQAPDLFTITTGLNIYTLTGTPIAPGSSKVYLNGVQLTYTTMYSITSNVLTLIPSGLSFNPETGMELKVFWY
jgi:hypothetical protein